MTFAFETMRYSPPPQSGQAGVQDPTHAPIAACRPTPQAGDRDRAMGPPRTLRSDNWSRYPDHLAALPDRRMVGRFPGRPPAVGDAFMPVHTQYVPLGPIEIEGVDVDMPTARDRRCAAVVRVMLGLIALAIPTCVIYFSYKFYDARH